MGGNLEIELKNFVPTRETLIFIEVIENFCKESPSSAAEVILG